MRKVTTHQAKTHLSKLLAEVERGEVVVIMRRGAAVAKLVRAERSKKQRRPKAGTVTSEIVAIDPSAFDPLDDEERAKWGLG
jgi:prevent-host-death family protein